MSVTLPQVSTPPRFCSVCKLAEGALSLIVQVGNEGVKHDWPSVDPWGPAGGLSVLIGLHHPDELQQGLTPTPCPWTQLSSDARVPARIML